MDLRAAADPEGLANPRRAECAPATRAAPPRRAHRPRSGCCREKAGASPGQADTHHFHQNRQT
eukprot:1564811-Pleurochrysis_carterae.AAC.1